MQYTCYTIRLSSCPSGIESETIYDLYSGALAEVGFDSFDTQDGKTLLAYIPTELTSDKALINQVLDTPILEGVQIDVTEELVPDINWNEEWEKHYFEPILIGENLCQIRAPFHEPNTEVQTEIIISPKMAFGTGNHETTALMMAYILENNMQGLRVLDMGCGTGILGILALKQGAGSLTAIDIDEWAYQNVLENAALNGVTIDVARQGDASVLEQYEPYDLILANITRNILFEDMPAYVRVLKQGGRLILSGFYEDDAPLLIERGEALGLGYVSLEVRNKWVRLELQRN